MAKSMLERCGAIRVGQLYRVPAYSDWFARGVTTVQVDKVGRKYIHVSDTLGRAHWRVAIAYFADNYEER